MDPTWQPSWTSQHANCITDTVKESVSVSFLLPIKAFKMNIKKNLKRENKNITVLQFHQNLTVMQKNEFFEFFSVTQKQMIVSSVVTGSRGGVST